MKEINTSSASPSHEVSCIVGPEVYSLSPERLLERCSVLRDGVHQKVSLDNLKTGELIFPPASMKLHLPFIVVDNLNDYTGRLSHEDCMDLLNNSDTAFLASSRYPDTPDMSDGLSDIRGFSERMVFHRQHSLSHQLLTNTLGDALWINVTGMHVSGSPHPPSQDHAHKALGAQPYKAFQEQFYKRLDAHQANKEFAEQFANNFITQMNEPPIQQKVSIEDLRDAKSHIGSITRDYHSCVNHGEKKLWLQRAETQLLKYRGFECARSKKSEDVTSAFKEVMNNLILQMEVGVKSLCQPEEPRVKRSLEDLPPESRRLLNINKTKEGPGLDM